MEAVNNLLRYHKGHKHYGLGSPLVDLHIPAGRERYAIFTDADNSSNPSVANKRRAHYGNNVSYRHSPEAIAATNGKASEITPIISNSKTLGVAVANRNIDESHVGLGSGENEIYALANTVNDGLQASYIFEELGMEFPLPMLITTDSTTAKSFAHGTIRRSKLNHIDQRQHWVQVCRDKRICDVEQAPGPLNNADVHTKHYHKHPTVFKRNRDRQQVQVPPTAFST